MDDVERHTERILRSARQSPPARIRFTSAQPRASARESSTPVAYAMRQHEKNSLKPAERRALRQINQQFYETRRLVRTDPRFTRQERAQLVAVLVFERMKAKQAITDPHQQENNSMKSAEIRALVDRQQKPLPQNSISGADAERIPPVRDRLRQLVTRAQEAVDEFKTSGRTQAGSAQDMYTKRARFSQSVHYLDKSTDKTVFVDTGKAIALRKHGISEGGVSVALDLARERFGSTLTIKGSEEFKRTVVEVAAKRGLDLHFTDPQMNQCLAERKAELAIEQEGQSIERGSEQAAPAGAEQEKFQEKAAAAPSPHLETVIRGQLVDHGPAPYQNDPAKDASYYVKLQTDQGERTLWGKDFEQLIGQGQFQPGERIQLQDHGTQPVDVVYQKPDGTDGTRVVERRTWTVEHEAAEVDRDTPAQAKTPEREQVATSGPVRDQRLDGQKILTVAGALREAGFDRQADVFAEAVFRPERWPDALANLRELAMNPAQACPEASMGAKEVAHRMFESVERDLYKVGVDFETVAKQGQVIEPPAPAADRDREIPFD